jgi:uncharacterized protein
MTRIARFVPALLLALVAVSPAAAQGVKATDNPFLWKVEGEGEKPSFLFGTMHLPDDRLTTLHPVVTEAIDFSDALYAELKMNDQATQMAAMGKMMLPQGTTLKATVGDDIYGRMETYLNGKGLGMIMPQLGTMKPWAVASQLGSLDYIMEMQMGKKALDAVIYARAESAGKEVGGLETVDEQIGVFESLTTEEQVKFLDKTLTGLEEAAEKGERSTEPLLLAYLTGKESEILKTVKEEMEAGKDDEMSKKLMKLLLDDRNVRMTDRIEKKLKENAGRSYFFAIGTMHYPGEIGIVALLEKKGFKVTRLSGKDAGTFAPAKEEKREPVGAGK